MSQEASASTENAAAVPAGAAPPPGELQPIVVQVGGSPKRRTHAPYTIKYALGNDPCKGPQPCKDSLIEADALQFGTWWGDCPWGPRWVWRHFRCVTPTVLKNLMDKIGREIEALDGFSRLSSEDQQLIRDTWEAGRPTGVSRLTVLQIKELLGYCGLAKKGDRGMLLASLNHFFATHGLSLEGEFEDLQLRIQGFAALRAMAPPMTASVGETPGEVEDAKPELEQESDHEDHKPAKRPRRAVAPRARKSRAKKVSIKSEPDPHPGTVQPLASHNPEPIIKAEPLSTAIVLAVDPEWVASMQPMFRRSARLANAPQLGTYSAPSVTTAFAPLGFDSSVGTGKWEQSGPASFGLPSLGIEGWQGSYLPGVKEEEPQPTGEEAV